MTSSPAPSLVSNYSHSFYPNGFRRYPAERKQNGLPDEVAFETGRFGLIIDVSDFQKVLFKRFEDESESLNYFECLSNRDRMKNLEAEELVLQIVTGGKSYRALSSAAADCREDQRNPYPLNNTVLLWEAGKLCQHYEFKGLNFKDSEGKALGCEVNLDVVVWPDSVAWTVWIENPPTPVAVIMRLKTWKVMKMFTKRELDTSSIAVTLPCNLDKEFREICNESVDEHVTIDGLQVVDGFNDRFNCQMASQGSFQRCFACGYTDIREYDDFHVKISNKSAVDVYYPFVLNISMPANTTGMCPIVCKPDGTPTGIPIQISKNWHYKRLGPYCYLFVHFPLLAESDAEYIIRVVYGFYGDLASAAHAQLSLVGYAKSSGRWDQCSVGCFGETYCMDPETSVAPVTITDIRGLMLRDGANGKMWNWTDCGWGGDWAKFYPSPNSKRQLWISALKLAYLSHGPCLTDVRYEGAYGDGRQVSFTARVRTMRTDDYVRTLTTLEYKFNDSVSVGSDGYLHAMKNVSFFTPFVAIGNSEGLIEDKTVPPDLKKDEIFEADVVLPGEAPFWISFYKNKVISQVANIGTGTKHMIIKSYSVNSNETDHTNPVVTFIDNEQKPGHPTSLCALVRPPVGMTEFQSGDTAKLELMWMTTPSVADNYYGPNDLLRAYVNLHPESWSIVMREIQYNHTNRIVVEGGTMESSYPLTVAVESETVVLNISGGLGGFPMEFTNLTHTNYTLSEEVDGEKTVVSLPEKNDFWQIDYETPNQTYTMTCNIMLGSSFQTKWILEEQGQEEDTAVC